MAEAIKYNGKSRIISVRPTKIGNFTKWTGGRLNEIIKTLNVHVTDYNEWIETVTLSSKEDKNNKMRC